MFQRLSLKRAAPARVVVLGARGVIGKALTATLEQAGIPVLPLSSADMDLLADDAAQRLSDLLKADDALVVLSALTPDKGRDTQTLMKNLRMADAVCTALRRSPCAHVVYMSSDAVYPFASGLVSEESPAAPTDLYGSMHRLREIMFTEACGSTPLACLRCTMVLADEDTHNSYGPNRFRRQAAAEGRIVLGGGGEETRDHVAVGDVARLIIEILQHRGAGILNLASGKSYSFRDVADMVADAMTPRPEVVLTERRSPATHRHFDTALLRRNFPEFRFTALDAAIQAVQSGQETA